MRLGVPMRVLYAQYFFHLSHLVGFGYCENV